MDIPSPDPDYFQSTRWSMVRRAVQGGQQGDVALEELCRLYRRPVELFIRFWTGNDPAAEDLVQDYFADLFRRGYLGRAREGAGKFRAFLLTDVKLFLNNARRTANAGKRGANVQVVSLDEITGSARTRADDAPEDALFDRHWAVAVFETAREKLRAEYCSHGRADVFSALEPQMDKPGEGPLNTGAVQRLGMSEGSLKVALHRMRARLGRHLLEIVSETVNTPDEAREELRYFFPGPQFRGRRRMIPAGSGAAMESRTFDIAASRGCLQIYRPLQPNSYN